MTTSETIHTETLPPEDFIKASTEMLATSIASILEKRMEVSKALSEKIAREGINDYIEREQNFMRKVLAAYERWSKEPNNVILWDVDDTLGSVQFDEQTKQTEWYFRPAMQLLIPYISNRYPEINNGIISNRGKDAALTGFDKYSAILESYPFFDNNFIFSVKDVKENTPAYSELSKELFTRNPGRTNPDAVRKLIIMQDLKSHHPEINWRVIDDNVVAKEMDENGVDVYELQPNVLSAY